MERPHRRMRTPPRLGTLVKIEKKSQFKKLSLPPLTFGSGACKPHKESRNG